MTPRDGFVRRCSSVMLACCCFAPMFAGGLAFGQEPKAAHRYAPSWTGRYADRPLTLPRLHGQIDIPFGMLALPGDNQAIIGFGGGFGITDDFEVNALAVPIVLAPEPAYGKPNIGALYRFIRGRIEIGATMRLIIPVEEKPDYQTYPPGEVLNFLLFWGAAARAHLGPVRIDSGLNFYVRFYDGQVGLLGASATPAAEPGLPIRVSYQIADWLHAGIVTGVSTLNFEQAVFSPAGVHLGATVSGGDGPMLDVIGRFDFPAFVLWDDVASGKERPIHTEIAFLGLSLSLYVNP